MRSTICWIHFSSSVSPLDIDWPQSHTTFPRSTITYISSILARPRTSDSSVHPLSSAWAQLKHSRLQSLRRLNEPGYHSMSDSMISIGPWVELAWFIEASQGLAKMTCDYSSVGQMTKIYYLRLIIHDRSLTMNASIALQSLIESAM